MNHFQSKHQGVRPNQMQCCGHDYRSQGIRLFAQHIWQHHRFEQPRNVQVDHRVSSLDEVCQTSRTLAALLPAPATLTPSLMVQQCEYPTTARMQGHIDAYNGAVVPTGVQQLQRSLDTPNDYVYQRDSTESLFPRALSMMLGYGAELHEPEVMPCESFDTCGSTYTRMGFDPCQGSEDVQSEKVREETPPLS